MNVAICMVPGCGKRFDLPDETRIAAAHDREHSLLDHAFGAVVLPLLLVLLRRHLP